MRLIRTQSVWLSRDDERRVNGVDARQPDVPPGRPRRNRPPLPKIYVAGRQIAADCPICLSPANDAATAYLIGANGSFPGFPSHHVSPGRTRSHSPRIAQTVCRVTALTANVLPSQRQSYLDAGMTYFLAKPVEAASLHRLLAAQATRL